MSGEDNGASNRFAGSVILDIKKQFSEQLETWSARATEAEAEVARLNALWEGLKAELKAHMATSRPVLRGIVSVEEINAPLAAENKRLTELVHQLNTRITQLSGDVEDRTEERDQHMKRCDDLTRQLHACSTIRDEIGLAKERRASAEVAEAKALQSAAFLESRCKELSADADKATQERDQALGMLQDKQDQIDAAEERTHQLEMEAIEHSDDVTALVRALARAEDEIMVMRRTRSRDVTSS